jgi:predicted PurR-regulated permease PerM
MSKNRRDDVVRLAAGTLFLFLVVAALRELAPLLKPLCAAVFLFYLTAPFYDRLRAWNVPRPVASAAPLLIGAAVVLPIGWILAWQAGLLVERLPDYWARLGALLEHSTVLIQRNLPASGPPLSALLPESGAQMAAARSMINTALWSLGDILSLNVLVFFYLVFIVIEADGLPRRLRTAYGDEDAERILAVGRRVNQAIKRYFFVKVAVSALLAGLSAATMLAFGLELPWLWTSLIFLGNFIPYLGSIVAGAFPVAVAFLQLPAPAAAALAALLLVWQLVVGYYIEPLFASRRLHLSPLVVMLTLALWGWLWGIVGLIVCVPLMVGLRFVLENIPETRKLAALMGEDPEG